MKEPDLPLKGSLIMRRLTIPLQRQLLITVAILALTGCDTKSPIQTDQPIQQQAAKPQNNAVAGTVAKAPQAATVPPTK